MNSKIKILYRTSESGYNKIKPDYVNNENCLKNAAQIFPPDLHEWVVIADNVSTETVLSISKYIPKDCIETVSIGHGAGTFNLALDKALQYEDDDIVYFLENDYIHKMNSSNVIEEGINMGAAFVSLYDHPDKYKDPNYGGNPHCAGGAEDTRVYLTESTHWKITNSTTMTFASKVSILKKNESILRKWTNTSHPHDFEMWLELRAESEILITPIPSYSTHGETAWLAPLIKWNEIC
jgi:hypothetical protein